MDNSINDEAIKLKNTFDVLRVFSNRLAILELSYCQFENLISEISNMMKTQNLIELEDYNYILKVEKVIYEVLANICSIRDSLRNKILATNKTYSQSYRSDILISKELPQKNDFLKNDLILHIDSQFKRQLFWYNQTTNGLKVIEFDNTSITQELSFINSQKSLEKFLKIYFNDIKNLGVIPKMNNGQLNGKLHPNFSELNNHHDDLWSSTLGQNLDLMNAVNGFRDKLIHGSQQKSIFLTATLEEKYLNIHFACDFHHLIEMLEWNDKYDKLYSYYLDNHLINLENFYNIPDALMFTIDSPQMLEIANRINNCNDRELEVAYVEYAQTITPNDTTIVVPQNLAIQIEPEKYKTAFKKLHDKLIKSKRYRLIRLFEYIDAKSKKDATARIKPIEAFFDLQAFTKDAYNLFYKYYSDLFSLVYNFYKPTSEYYNQLQAQLGCSETEIEKTNALYKFKSII